MQLKRVLKMNTQCAICQRPIQVPPPLLAHLESILGEVTKVTCMRCESHAMRVKKNQFDEWMKTQDLDEFLAWREQQPAWKKHANRRKKIISAPIQDQDWNNLLEELEKQNRKERGFE